MVSYSRLRPGLCCTSLCSDLYLFQFCQLCVFCIGLCYSVEQPGVLFGLSTLVSTSTVDVCRNDEIEMCVGVCVCVCVGLYVCVCVG